MDIKGIMRHVLSRCIIPGCTKASSGKVIENYVDCRRITTSPPYVQWLGELLYEKVRQLGGMSVGGLELGAVPLVVAVCYHASLVHFPLKGFIVRKKPKQHGTGKLIEGDFWYGLKAVILEDVVTTGASALQAVKAAEEAGMDVVGVVALVDRGEGGADKIRKNYTFRSLFTLDELLECRPDIKKPKSLFDLIEERKEFFGTKNNTFDMFPVGTRVRVITFAQDFRFFEGDETGVVVRNTGERLGIIVKFDTPLKYDDGYRITEFGFNPDDLIVLEEE